VTCASCLREIQAGSAVSHMGDCVRHMHRSDCIQALQQQLEAERAKVAAKDNALKIAATTLDGINAIAAESTGIAGYHLNGAIAEWGDLDLGIDAAIAALQQPEVKP
jgi:hypothetical protein